MLLPIYTVSKVEIFRKQKRTEITLPIQLCYSTLHYVSIFVEKYQAW